MMPELRSPNSRLKLLVPFEPVPTHFPSVDGSGLFEQRETDELGSCVYKVLTGDPAPFNQRSDVRPPQQPAGLYPFICAPITNRTAAEVRMTALYTAAKTAGFTANAVWRRFDALFDRCDVHDGVNNDCLHSHTSDKDGAASIQVAYIGDFDRAIRNAFRP
jgi:hypothetical protein